MILSFIPGTRYNIRSIYHEQTHIRRKKIYGRSECWTQRERKTIKRQAPRTAEWLSFGSEKNTGYYNGMIMEQTITTTVDVLLVGLVPLTIVSCTLLYYCCWLWYLTTVHGVLNMIELLPMLYEYISYHTRVVELFQFFSTYYYCIWVLLSILTIILTTDCCGTPCEDKKNCNHRSCFPRLLTTNLYQVYSSAISTFQKK